MTTNPEEPDCLTCMDSMRVRTCDDDECACDENCCYADCPECCEQLCQHEPDHTLPGKQIEREGDGRLTILIPCKKCGEYY